MIDAIGSDVSKYQVGDYVSIFGTVQVVSDIKVYCGMDDRVEYHITYRDVENGREFHIKHTKRNKIEPQKVENFFD
jgi:hypothetical protein